MVPGEYRVFTDIPRPYEMSYPGSGHPARGEFAIDLRFAGNMTPILVDAANWAKSRWEGLIRRDLPDVVAPWGATIDDAFFDVLVGVLPSGVVAQNEVLRWRDGQNGLPYWSRIILNQDYLSQFQFTNLTAAQDILAHEIGHGLGLNRINYEMRGLITTTATGLAYSGRNGVAEYNNIFGKNVTSIPLDSTGNHVSSAAFGGPELMSPSQIDQRDPLSTVTLGMMQDVGHDVDYALADPIAPPGQTPPPRQSRGWTVKVPENGFVNANFGLTEFSTMTGTVYVDQNGSRIRDPAEVGASQVTVFLDSDWDDVLDASEQRTVTNDSGSYAFAGLWPGEYSVRIVTPAGFVQIDQPTPFFVRSGTATLVGGFAIAQPGTVSGKTFNDANSNGRLDSGEPTLTNVEVFVDSNANSIRDLSEVFVVSGPDGSYSFTNLLPGSVVINQVPLTGYARTTEPIRVTVFSGSQTVSANLGQVRIQPVLQFSRANYYVSESGVTGSSLITINRTGDTSLESSVTFTSFNSAGAPYGSATHTVDYTGTNQVVTFRAGETTKTITVSIKNDSTAEVDETVALRMLSPSGATLGPQSTSTLTIVDDDRSARAFANITRSEVVWFFNNRGGAAQLEATQMPVDAIVFFRTNSGLYGKLQVLRYTQNELLVNRVVFDAAGRVYSSGRLTLRANSTYDLSHGIASAHADVWWAIESGRRYLRPFGTSVIGLFR